MKIDFRGESQKSIDKTENGGIIETSNNTDSSEISEKTENKKTGKVYSFEEYYEHPELLGESTPEEKYEYYTSNKYDVRSLRKGSYGKIPYKNGGGYRVLFGDKQSVLSYHPKPLNRKEHHHGDGEYYKLATGGGTGKKTVWHYNIDGSELIIS